MSIYGWFPLRLTGLISSLSRELPGVFSSTIVWRQQFFGALPSLQSGSHTTMHDHWEDHSLDYTDLHWQSDVSAFPHTVWVCHNFPAKKQSSSDFMAAVILGPKKRKSVTASTFLPSICHEVKGPDAMILVFLIFAFKSAFPLSSFTLIKRFFSSYALSAIRVVSATYLRLLMFFPPILIPACNSCSLAFLKICSAYKLNKWGDNRQTCCTPFSILNQSVVPYRVLTVASWPTYRFLRR